MFSDSIAGIGFARIRTLYILSPQPIVYPHQDSDERAHIAPHLLPLRRARAWHIAVNEDVLGMFVTHVRMVARHGDNKRPILFRH